MNWRHELVAQPEPGLERGEAGAEPLGRNVLKREIKLHPRLQDQLPGQALVVLGLEAGGEIPLVRQKGRRIDLEPVRRQPLDPEHEMATPAQRLSVVANASLQVEPGIDGMAPQGLDLGLLRLFAKAPLDLALQPELVDVAAVPPLYIEE